MTKLGWIVHGVLLICNGLLWLIVPGLYWGLYGIDLGGVAMEQVVRAYAALPVGNGLLGLLIVLWGIKSSKALKAIAVVLCWNWTITLIVVLSMLLMGITNSLGWVWVPLSLIWMAFFGNMALNRQQPETTEP